MAFQPLTREQYQNALSSGFSHDQIVQYELQRKQSMNGGSTQGFGQQEQPSFLKRVGGFFGGIARDITKPVVTSLARPVQLEESLRTGETPTFNLPFFGKLEPPKSIGEAVGTGLKTISLPLGPVAGGATFFGGQQLEEGKGLGSAALGAAGGAVLGGLTFGAGKVLEKVPSTAWSAILKRVPTAAVKNPDLEKQIAAQGIVGITKRGIAARMGKEIQGIELEIADLLSGKAGKISTGTVASKLESLKSKYANIPGEQSSVDTIDSIAKELRVKGKNLTIQEANQLKRDIYGIVQKTYGKGLLEVPAKRESQKLIARGLKEEIERVVPEVKNLNARQAIFIQAKDAIDKTIARETGKGIAGTGIGLYELLAAGLGTIAGFATHNIIPGIEAVAGIEALKSPALLSTVATGSQKIVKFFSGLSPTQKAIFYNGLRGFIEEASGGGRKSAGGSIPQLKSNQPQELPPTSGF